MLKEKIKYTDFNGAEREEDAYFHFSKAEVVELSFTKDGSMEDRLNNIAATEDQAELLKLLKELILKAYGEKSADGRRFIKSEQLSTEFYQTEAYSQLFMRLASDADAMSKFVKGIMPADFTKKPEMKVLSNA